MSPSTRTVATLTTMGFMLLAAPVSAESRVELLMVEARGCAYCARWHAEVGPAYPATAEGQFAPLRQIDISASVPEDIRLESRPVFTPTFILLENGQELGRIEGYPGEDFFWGLFERMLRAETSYGEHSS